MYGPLLLISGSHTKLTLSIRDTSFNMNKPKSTKTKLTGATRASAPVAKGIVQKLSKPKFSMTKSDGSVRISHKEYVRDILGTVAFQGDYEYINPGSKNIFPWLSTIAPSYESYRFSKLKFSFESTSATTHSGAVMMAVDYDPDDLPPYSKTQMMSYSGAVRGPPWESFDLVCSKADMSKLPQRFVRSGQISGTDRRLYDLGQLIVCTAGQQNTNPVGELYVEYEVEFMTPQLDLLAAANAASCIVRAGGTISLTNWMGTAPTFTGGLSVTANATPYGFNFPYAGSYLIVFSSAGTGLVPNTLAATSVGNIVINAPAASSGTWTIQQLIVNIADPLSPVVIPSLHSAGTVTAFNARIATYYSPLG